MKKKLFIISVITIILASIITVQIFSKYQSGWRELSSRIKDQYGFVAKIDYGSPTPEAIHIYVDSSKEIDNHMAVEVFDDVRVCVLSDNILDNLQKFHQKKWPNEFGTIYIEISCQNGSFFRFYTTLDNLGSWRYLHDGVLEDYMPQKS